MKHIVWPSLIFLAFAGLLQAQAPDASEILRSIDRNISSGNKIITYRMIIHGRRADRTMSAKSWIQGTMQAFTEYLSPPREKGTKMLKIGDELWTYSPDTDRIIKISGHMLRQSVMGSDLSYEDMMEDPEFSSNYHSEISGVDTLLGRPCWILELTALRSDLAYYKRSIWVDRERSLILKENRNAKSGMLLKTTEVRETVRTGGKWVAKHVIFKDVLKNGTGTEFIIDSIAFDAEIPEYVFSKASLRK